MMCNPVGGGGMPPLQPGVAPSAGANATPGGAAAPGTTVAGATGGDAAQAAAGAQALGGGADLASVLRALVDALTALVAALGQQPTSGGGGCGGSLPPGMPIDPDGGGAAAQGYRKP